MRKAYLSSLLFAFLTSASLALSAAPATKPDAAGATAAVVSTQSSSVNLNTADANTLQTELSGIGKAKAEAIVAYREANGSFASVDELLEVKGIGKALLDKNRDKVTVN